MCRQKKKAPSKERYRKNLNQSIARVTRLFNVKNNTEVLTWQR